MDIERYHALVLCDPTVLTPGGYPSEVITIGLILRVSRSEIGTTEELDGAIERILAHEEREQLREGWPYLDADRCCSLCASALRLDHCPGCHVQFRDDSFSHPSGVAVPPKVREWLEGQGYVFLSEEY